MGDIAQEILKGDRCQECGVPTEGLGFPISCRDCMTTPQPKKKGPRKLKPDVIRVKQADDKSCFLEGHTSATKGNQLLSISETDEPGRGSEILLTQQTVTTLLPLLQRFARTGRLTPAIEE